MECTLYYAARHPTPTWLALIRAHTCTHSGAYLHLGEMDNPKRHAFECSLLKAFLISLTRNTRLTCRCLVLLRRRACRNALPSAEPASRRRRRVRCVAERTHSWRRQAAHSANRERLHKDQCSSQISALLPQPESQR